MILKDRGPLSPQALASELLRQQEVLRAQSQATQTLISRIAGFEARYGIHSEEVHVAIESGRLQETEEVCDWIIDYELLRESQSGSSRVE